MQQKRVVLALFKAERQTHGRQLQAARERLHGPGKVLLSLTKAPQEMLPGIGNSQPGRARLAAQLQIPLPKRPPLRHAAEHLLMV